MIYVAFGGVTGIAIGVAMTGGDFLTPVYWYCVGVAACWLHQRTVAKMTARSGEGE